MFNWFGIDLVTQPDVCSRKEKYCAHCGELISFCNNCSRSPGVDYTPLLVTPSFSLVLTSGKCCLLLLITYARYVAKPSHHQSVVDRFGSSSCWDLPTWCSCILCVPCTRGMLPRKNGLASLKLATFWWYTSPRIGERHPQRWWMQLKCNYTIKCIVTRAWRQTTTTVWWFSCRCRSAELKQLGNIESKEGEINLRC